MKNVGKISIVLPCYKAERFVGDMIGDIEAQTYKDWELIVVSNGAGQEAQLKVINGFAKNDSRIKVVSVEQGGVSNARNIGMAKATGDWLSFVDADDRCDSNHLELLAEGVNDNTDVVVAGLRQIWPKRKTSNVYELEPNHTLDKYFVSSSAIVLGSPCSKLFSIRELRNWGGGNTTRRRLSRKTLTSTHDSISIPKRSTL